MRFDKVIPWAQIAIIVSGNNRKQSTTQCHCQYNHGSNYQPFQEPFPWHWFFSSLCWFALFYHTSRYLDSPRYQLAICHTCTVSSLAEARVRPSGDQATVRTQDVCPVYVFMGSSAKTDQIWTVVSSPPEATKMPSGDQVTALMA